MAFRFETVYHPEAFTVMAKALRKTVRKKRSRLSHIFGILMMISALLLTFTPEFAFDFTTVITWLVVAAVLVILILEDHINGYLARKQMMPGLEKAVVTFKPEGYHSETEIGSSDFHYDKIRLLVETADYLVFVLSQNHAQVYHKKSITGGTMEEFRAFITNVTGKEIQTIERDRLKANKSVC